MISPTIAIVNNEPTFRYLLSRFLTERGHDVLTESNEDSAMGTLVCRQPEAVVIEVSAESRFSVSRLVERMRANPATAFMPVIVCASDEQFHQQHAADLEMFGCRVMGRPFNGDVLLDVINSMLPRTTASLSYAAHA